MNGTLHIKRQDANGNTAPIPLKDWKHVVERTEGIRMASGDAVSSTPAADGMVVLPNRGGDAEIFRKDCNTWMRAMFWTPGGTIRFAAPRMRDDPIADLAEALARSLGARVCDDPVTAEG